MTEQTNEALWLATGAVDPLRTACRTIEAAVDRSASHLAGADHRQPATGLTCWADALTAAWQALNLVHAGIAEARQLPGATPASVADVLDGLRAARADADRAAADTARLRRQLAIAEDRLRRTDTGARARAAAEKWRIAGARLDLVTARLAIGTRLLDRYAAALTGAGEPPHPLPGLTAPGPAGPPGMPSEVAPSEVAAGAKTAGTVLLVVHPWRGRRGFWARVRCETRRAWSRSRPW